MTVAAVFSFDSSEDALADAAGRPAVRRMVEAAWAGGATPIVVVARDASGAIAQSLAGSPAVLAEPASEADGPLGQALRGIRVAAEQVSETDAVLLWPGRMAWVDAETATSLMERHGVERDSIIRPEYDGAAGWPALLPMGVVDDLAGLPAALTLDQLLDHLAAQRRVSLFDTGDPGTLHDISVGLDSMPAYGGPPEPARQAPEWGLAAADSPDEGPLEGPALAPYSQAADPEGD